MPQSLAQVYIHLVFSTKDRRPFLRDETFRNDVHAYLGGICGEQKSPALMVGGAEDHVHILVSMGREISISELVRELKRASTMWIQNEKPDHADFLWQSGYGAFSVSPAHREKVTEYIRNQMEHHKEQDFQTEYRRILAKYGVEFKEQYVWE